ncbi:MAG: hypothetical protein U1F65_03650 [Verrucomicrobiota bacterium]
MKIRTFILAALSVQVIFLIYWLFSSPGVGSELRIARDELQEGDADLPALNYLRSDSPETTVAYDRTKSASENLVARALLRLSIADDGYTSLVRITLAFALLSVIFSAVMLVLSGRRPNWGQSTFKIVAKMGDMVMVDGQTI